MDKASAPTPLTPAAFAYATACAVTLVLLPRLEGPLKAYGAAHSGALLLGRDPLEGLLWGIGAGAVGAVAGQAITRFTPWGKLLSRLLGRAFEGIHPADALLLAALSSFGEELVFRGLALPYFGLPVSSALFGLAHVIPRKGLWLFGIWAGLNGLALGWIALATGGLLASVTAHFLINAVGLLLLTRSSAPEAQA